MEWDPRHLADHNEVEEISGPAHSHYLTNVSNLRMARTEMEREQSQSVSPAHTHMSPGGVALSSTFATASSNQLHGYELGGHNRVATSHSSQVASNISRVDRSSYPSTHGAMVPPDVPAHHNSSLMPVPVPQQPGSLLPFSTNLEMNHARLASEMSDYIIWNAGDLNPWFSFDNDDLNQRFS